jgi:DNA modification methylase
MNHQILVGDVLDQLATLPDESVHTCITSPPYWGLRDYGVEGMIGLEPTPEEFIEKMVAVFREVRRVLRDDGTCWVNLGDCYAQGATGKTHNRDGDGRGGCSTWKLDRGATLGPGLKPKDLCMMPARVALALQADGWYLRSQIIWAKGVSFCPSYSGSVMPESCRDRPTSAYEVVYLLTKSSRYFYDGDAVRESDRSLVRPPQNRRTMMAEHPKSLHDVCLYCGGSGEAYDPPDQTSAVCRGCNGSGIARYASNRPEYRDTLSNPAGRNLRNVWAINPQPFPDAHFATFPEKLVEPMVKAGTSEKGCCPECGKPHERVVERESVQTRPGNVSATDHTAPHLQSRGSGGNTELRYRPESSVTTLGFRPACECDHNDETPEYWPHKPVPCTVLDPFSGSGTTGVVACHLGRDYIGIELNPEYAAMSERRIGKALRPSTYRDQDEATPYTTLFDHK